MLDKIRWSVNMLALLALAVFISFSPFIKGVITEFGAMLILLAIISFALAKKRLEHFDADIRLLLFGFIAYIAVAFLSLINNQDFSVAGHRLERYIVFLGAIFLVFLLTNTRHLLNKVLLISSVIGGLSVGGYAVYEQVFLGFDRTGLNTGMGINSFAHMCSLLSTILAGYLLLSGGSRLIKTLILICFVTSLYAVFSTVSRLTIIGLFFSLIWLAWLYLSVHQKNINAKLLFAVLTIFLLVALQQLPYLTDRMIDMANNATRFFGGDNTYTSTSARLMMWLGGFKMWMANFWIGTGIGDTPVDYQMLMDTDQIPYMSQPITVLHNNFVDMFATTGLIGLVIGTFAVYFVPSYLFYKNIKQADVDSSMYVAAAIGMAVMINNFIFGIGHSWLYIREVPYCVVIMLVLLVMSQVKQEPVNTLSSENSHS